VAYLVLFGASAAVLRDIDNTWLAVLSEPLGMRALSRTIRYWSTAERNNGVPGLAGYLLANRALWLGVTALLFAATFALFRTERSGGGRRRWGRRQAQPVADAALRPTAPVAARGTGIQRDHRVAAVPAPGALRYTRRHCAACRSSCCCAGPGQFPAQRAVPADPVRHLDLAGHLADDHGPAGAFSWLLVIIVLFFAGELVWKERSARINEVTDAMPVPNWVPLLAKFTALLAVIICFRPPVRWRRWACSWSRATPTWSRCCTCAAWRWIR
jgi:hypothetical protein